MKKIFLDYETPEVEILEVNVEKGFANSSVVDGGGGDEPLFAVRQGRDEAQIGLQQRHYLIHIQAEVGDRIPIGQMVTADVVVPALQLVDHQFLVVRHIDTSAFSCMNYTKRRKNKQYAK